MNTRKIVPVHHKTLIRLFEIDGFAVKRQRGDHIIEKNQEALLCEGYQAEKEEGLEMTKEFEAVDFENWDDY
jgi:hypothetical protein